MDMNIKLLNNYELLAIEKDGKEYNAIINRNTKATPYVVCMGYNLKDGTWDYGLYCEDEETAFHYLYRRKLESFEEEEVISFEEETIEDEF